MLRRFLLISALPVLLCDALTSLNDAAASHIVVPSLDGNLAELPLANHPSHDAITTAALPARPLWNARPNLRVRNFDVTASQSQMQGGADEAHPVEWASVPSLVQTSEAETDGISHNVALSSQNTIVRGLPVHVSKLHENSSPLHMVAVFVVIVGFVALMFQWSSSHRRCVADRLGNRKNSDWQAPGPRLEERARSLSSLASMFLSTCRVRAGPKAEESLKEYAACTTDRGS